LLADVHAGGGVRELDHDSSLAAAPSAETDVLQRVLHIRSAFGEGRACGSSRCAGRAAADKVIWKVLPSTLES